MTPLTRPVTNARGRPWKSRGRRNLACAGTGRGNGGVVAPGRYQRRRGWIGPDEHHDNYWRHDWRIILAHLRDAGTISPNAYAVGSHLIDFSDDKASHTYPSQATVGARMDRSASTAHRALAELRAAGILEWDHRFEGPTHDNPRPHPTSNLYEFVIPAELAKAAGLKRRVQRLTGRTAHHRPGRRHPPGRGRPAPALSFDERQRRERQRAAESRVLAEVHRRDAVYIEIVEEIESTYRDDPELANYALEYLATHWPRSGP